MGYYPVLETRVLDEFQDYFVKTQQWDIRAILENAVLSFEYITVDEEVERIIFSVVLPERVLDFMDIKSGKGVVRKLVLKRAFWDAVQSFGFHGSEMVDLVLTVVPEAADEETIGLNNCFFKTESLIEHDQLRFRSEVETIIYNELKKRDLLFFPNAAAVLGGEKCEKREPDFLICHKGKWGILEVMGDTYHKNAAKDHDRARLFKKHGVLCMEFFTANECKWSAAKVVDKFLSILAQH
jgi:hypothetical protein